MTCKWNGAVYAVHGPMTSSCTLLSTVTASAQLWSKTRVLRFSWVSTYRDGNKVALLLLESNHDACCLSLSPRRRKGGVRTGRRRWTADVSFKARRHQRWWDDNDQPQARWCFTNNNLSRLHLNFACLSMTQDRTTTYRVTTCATATRLSLVVWHVWRFLVRYNNRGRRRRVDQNDRSFLSFFFHFWSKNSAETWNNRSPRSKEHFGAKKLEIYLRQKSRFWSVHACLKKKKN